MTDKNSSSETPKKPKGIEDLDDAQRRAYQKLAKEAGIPISRNRSDTGGRPAKPTVKSIPKKLWAPVPSSPLLKMFGLSPDPSFLGSVAGRVVSSSKLAEEAEKAEARAKVKERPQRKTVRNPKIKGVPLVTTHSRARTVDAFKSSQHLMALRTKTWFSYLLAATIPAEAASAALAISIDNFIRYIDETQPTEITVDLKGAFEDWLIAENLSETSPNYMRGLPHHFCERSYETGRESPTASTLLLFESYVPGSKAVYDHGLYALPVWAILSGDIKACKSFVADNLAQSSLFQSLDQQFETLLEGLLPYYAIPESKQLKRFIESICTDAQNNAVSSGVVHPLLESRIDSIYAAVEGDSFTDDQIAALPILVLVAYALYKICLAEKSGPILQLEWLVMGLCCGLYSDLFTADIQEYISHDLGLNGDLLTQHFESQGTEIIPFDQRWSSYGLY